MLLLDPCVPVVTNREPGPAATMKPGRYVGPMHVSASQVGAVLAAELPGLDERRLHRLLYYVQGHHLALRGRPAFDEPVIAGPDGPHIHGDIQPAGDPRQCPEPQANVALLVAARYSGLTGADLDRLTQAEAPWQATNLNAEIPPDRLREFFAGPGAQQHADRYPPQVVDRLREGVNAARAAARNKRPARTADRTADKVAGDGR